MRLPNWPALMNAAIDEARTWPYMPFGCLHFCGHVALAITGEDKRPLFPAYSSQEEAEAILTQYGGLAGILTHALGDPIPAKKAGRGDIVLAEVDDGEIISGICVGARAIFLAREGGITDRPMTCARLAWRVG